MDTQGCKEMSTSDRQLYFYKGKTITGLCDGDTGYASYIPLCVKRRGAIPGLA